MTTFYQYLTSARPSRLSHFLWTLLVRLTPLMSLEHILNVQKSGLYGRRYPEPIHGLQQSCLWPYTKIACCEGICLYPTMSSYIKHWLWWVGKCNSIWKMNQQNLTTNRYWFKIVSWNIEYYENTRALAITRVGVTWSGPTRASPTWLPVTSDLNINKFSGQIFKPQGHQGQIDPRAPRARAWKNRESERIARWGSAGEMCSRVCDMQASV